MGWDDNGLNSSAASRSSTASRATRRSPTTRRSTPPDKPAEAGRSRSRRPNFVELLRAQLDRGARAGYFEPVVRRSACRSTGADATRRSARRPRARRSAAFLAALARRPRLPRRGADAVGRRLQDRRRAGRARGPRAAGCVPPARLPPAPTTASRVFIETTRPELLAGVRRARRPSRRRALPAAVRHDGHHAAVRRRGAGRRPRARRPREGLGHRDDLHVRRHHRRHVVARAASCRSALDRRAGRPPDRRRRPTASRPTRPGRVRRARGQDRQAGAGPHRRAAPRVRRAGRRAEADHPPGEVLGERRPTARDRHQPAVVHRATRRPGRDARPRQRAALVPRLHAGPLRELGQRPRSATGTSPASASSACPSRSGTRSTTTATVRHDQPLVSPTRRASRSTRRPTCPTGYDEPTSATSPAGSSATPTSWTRGPRRRSRRRSSARWVDDPDLFDRVFPMDLRPQAHEIIRTWLFSTVVRSHYEHGRAAVGRRRDLRVRPRPRPQEDVEVEGQHRRRPRRRSSPSSAPTRCATGPPAAARAGHRRSTATRSRSAAASPSSSSTRRKFVLGLGEAAASDTADRRSRSTGRCSPRLADVVDSATDGVRGLRLRHGARAHRDVLLDASATTTSSS